MQREYTCQYCELPKGLHGMATIGPGGSVCYKCVDTIPDHIPNVQRHRYLQKVKERRTNE